MADDEMTLERFEDLLDRHGGDLDAWPDRDAAQAARALILRDPAARRSFDAARRLDGLLDARLEALEADPGLAERTAAAVAPTVAAPSGEMRRWAMRLAASFLVAAVVGGAAERIAWELPPADEAEVVMLESLVYGLGEGELP